MPRDFSHVDIRTLPLEHRPRPTTGQSSAPFHLPLDGMNPHERAVVRAANRPTSGRREVYDVRQLARTARRTLLQTRNALRRLVPGNWVERVPEVEDPDTGDVVAVRGRYRVTRSGRDRLASADER